MVIVDDGIVAGKATGRLTDLLSTMQLTRFVTKCQDIYVAQVSNTALHKVHEKCHPTPHIQMFLAQRSTDFISLAGRQSLNAIRLAIMIGHSY